MPRKNNFIIYILAQLLLLFFILIIIPTFFLKEKPGIFQTSFKDTLPLNVNSSYSQSFISDRANLNSVSVLLKNLNLEGSDSVDLEIQDKNKENLQSLTIFGSAIQDPGWIRFKFPPTNSQKGDIFYLTVTTNSNKKDSKLYIYGDNQTKNINFKTTYKYSSLKESFKDNLKQQISNFKSRNIFQTGFYLFVIVLINRLILI